MGTCADEIRTAGFPQGLHHDPVVFGVKILEQGPLHGFFPVGAGDMYLL